MVTGTGIRMERDMLIGFDLLLVIVFGLILYSISARDPLKPADGLDVLQLVLIVAALLVDSLALWAILARITEFGFTPNRVAALGENLVLVVSLARSAWLYLGFIRGRTGFGSLEKWQTDYLPVYAVWMWVVVLVFPLMFQFS